MRFYSTLLLGVMSFANICFAQSNTNNLEISIYNNNLALVKDTRSTKLEVGNNDIAFEGVASAIKSESVIIDGVDIKVLEQNYDYDLITSDNIVKKSIGKEVKTITQNPTTGENIFGKAKIVSAVNSVPVLEFDYGIEANFDGRLVFDKIPAGLREKPTLMAKIYSPKAGVQDLGLAYLTNGISWKTNYVAYVKDSENLSLTAWVTINNQSGADYENAKISLIAGDVNQVSGAKMPRVYNRSITFGIEDGMIMEAADVGSVKPEQISSFQLYNLPNRASINTNQTKQMSLFGKENVKYEKEGRLDSPFYFNAYNTSSFEKVKPSIFYVLNNTKEGGLDLPMPMGTVRFYENDSNDNMQFIGENNINHVAKGEKIELRLGSMFNVFANGKIKDVKEISRGGKNNLMYIKVDGGDRCYNVKLVKGYFAEVTFNNGGADNATLVFKQYLGENKKIVATNIEGKLKNANEYEWRIDVPAETEKKLEFTVHVETEERVCD